MRVFLPYTFRAQNHAGHGIVKGAKNPHRKFNRPSGLREEVVLSEKPGGNEVLYHIPSMHKTIPCTV
ncbi:MAG: hypothetical protein LBR26_01640 [Prevotella sp.]|nr:hypothetical protein [Prevotella sp.]